MRVVGYATGGGQLGTNNDWLSVGGTARLTTDLKYLPLTIVEGYGLINDSDQFVFFDLALTVRDAAVHEITKAIRVPTPKWELGNVTIGGREWRTNRITGVIPPKSASGTFAFIKLDFTIKTGITSHPECLWALYSSRTPVSDSDLSSGPVKDPDEPATTYPWLSFTTTVKRDEDGVEELGDSVPAPADPTNPSEEQASGGTEAPPPVVAGPAGGTYKFNWRFTGDPVYYQLLGDKLASYGGPGYGYVWYFTRLSEYNDRITMTGNLPANGIGFLGISSAGVSYTQTRSELMFVVTSNGLALRGLDGYYICWANTPTVGTYETSSRVYVPGVTTDITQALLFQLE